MILNKQIFCAVCLAILPQISNGDIIDFDFTGRLSIGDPGDGLVSNQPIAASFSYDTDLGIGNSSLLITTDQLFFGFPMTFHDISMNRIDGSNLIDGTVLVDWNVNNDMLTHIEWDASGLFNAIDMELQVGDTISGTDLIRDGSFLADVNSATPYSDQLTGQSEFISYAPLAATSNTLGFGSETPFPGFKAYFDIGSGNSLHVTGYSVSSVPVPAAVWLFGSGLLGLVGMARRKKAA